MLSLRRLPRRPAALAHLLDLPVDVGDGLLEVFPLGGAEANALFPRFLFPVLFIGVKFPGVDQQSALELADVHQPETEDECRFKGKTNFGQNQSVEEYFI